MLAFDRTAGTATEGEVMITFNKKKIEEQVKALIWYHTIDLGRGLETPGHYDHRTYVHHFGLPENLKGKTALDIGTASGFFAFEMEKRGAQVTATDLPRWTDHDFGPNYQPDRPLEELEKYLHEPFDLAKRLLRSKVEKLEINIYDLSPDIVGRFDIVFCSSVLLHLTDPIKALQRIHSLTREKAIICTAIDRDAQEEPWARFFGSLGGTTWWLPNRCCLEAMIRVAGFESLDWYSEFQMDFRDGRPGHYCGVVHAQGASANKQEATAG
jgi:tRNA (mo5U34)-methyltransferase